MGNPHPNHQATASTQTETEAVCRQIAADGFYPAAAIARLRYRWHNGDDRNFVRWRNELSAREGIVWPKKQTRSTRKMATADMVLADVIARATREPEQPRPVEKGKLYPLVVEHLKAWKRVIEWRDARTEARK